MGPIAGVCAEYPDLSPVFLRELGVYGGAQGIWVDKNRTGRLSSDGVAVAVLHTGRHYADDLSDLGIVYHYPRTRRPAGRDAAEVAAVKACETFKVPIFVISETSDGNRRRVRLAWVTAHDDPARIFLITFGDQPALAPDIPHPDDPFRLETRRRRTRADVERAIRDPNFNFAVNRRYEGRCVVVAISVPEMLDAVHLVPVERGGVDDERNALLLTASLHRALDTRALGSASRRPSPNLSAARAHALGDGHP